MFNFAYVHTRMHANARVNMQKVSLTDPATAPRQKFLAMRLTSSTLFRSELLLFGVEVFWKPCTHDPAVHTSPHAIINKTRHAEILRATRAATSSPSLEG